MATDDTLFALRDSLQGNIEDIDNEIQRRVYDYLEFRKRICGHTIYPRLAL